MSTTTVGDLLERAEGLARVLRIDDADVSATQWRALDATAYRLLAELNGRERTGTRAQIAGRASVKRIVNTYPSPLATPSSETTFHARQAASHLGLSYDTIIKDIHRSRLPATYDGRLERLPWPRGLRRIDCSDHRAPSTTTCWLTWRSRGGPGGPERARHKCMRS